MRTFRFYREEKKWYVDLPEWEGDKWELEMVAGADDMLDMIAGKSGANRQCRVYIALEPFNEDESNFPLTSHKLIKVKDTPDIGGALYYLDNWYGQDFKKEIWLCHILEFIFNGQLPKIIYIG